MPANDELTERQPAGAPSLPSLPACEPKAAEAHERQGRREWPPASPGKGSGFRGHTGLPPAGSVALPWLPRDHKVVFEFRSSVVGAEP